MNDDCYLYRCDLDQAMFSWKRYGVMNKGDVVGSCGHRSTIGKMMHTHGLAYVDKSGILRASISRKQLQLLIDMENL